MTVAEALGDLRDIHEPVAAGAPPSLSLWPFAVLAGLVLLGISLRWWRRGAWRREARAALRQIERMDAPETRAAALGTLLPRVARHRRPGTVPQALFRPGAPDPGPLRTLIARMIRQ